MSTARWTQRQPCAAGFSTPQAPLLRPLTYLQVRTRLARLLRVVSERHPAISESRLPLKRPITIPQFTTTNSDGAFSLTLLPGSYAMLAVPDDRGESGRDSQRRTEPTYYPSEVDSTRAQRILVDEPKEMFGYEIRLRETQVYRVSGQVFNETGAQARQVAVRLDRTPIIHPVTITGAQGILRGSAVVDYPPEEGSTETDDEGRFSYCCVAPGDWQVVAEFTPGNVPGQIGATSVDVTKDIEGLEI
jgi:hypothetical protein